ncbi:hypothetical protein R3P38DRAFT_3188637 [Favolaschia claudopus]|uniref:Tyr recombinase domain-containing protein n=1 Tax=Favolaschia claudopus TaxID=2862362 RepID=A0AAW0BTY2_9AGAR
MSAARTLRSHKKASSTSAPKSAKSRATKSATTASVKKTRPKITRQSKAGQHAESKSTAQPSSTSLLKHSQQTTDEWYKAARTKNGYANYVKSGKKWLAEWTSEGRLDDEIGADAFDVIAEHTPLALRALTAYKCEHLERGFSSAEGLRSAFKDYFERVCGCQGDFWKYNSHTQKWEGNPVFESSFKTYYESLKNRHNRTGTATQALPMLPADLKVIMTYLDSDEGAKAFTVTQRLYFKAFASTAFTLWTRNDELVNLQFKDVKMDLRSKTGIPYHEFSLIFRKTNKDPTKVHPEIDCYTHVKTWKIHMEGLLGRSLTGNDFVFPALASTGQVKFGEPTSRSAFETLLNDVVEKSDALHGRNGKFTTHCFRRGGAQYRFLWADRKWSLKAVKWWGGWSSNENVGTLMRYLLDELMAYEEGFSDIMMDDRVIDRHETFMGEDNTAPLSKADLVKFEESMVAKLQLILSESTAARMPPLVQSLAPPDCTEPSSTPESLARTSDNPPTSSSSPLSPASSPEPYVPRPSRIPSTKSLDDALTYWNHGAPGKGLDVPLKDWLTLFRPLDYSSEGVKFGNIRFVCEEFYTHCNGDFTLFELEFPGLRQRFTLLMKAVREKRKTRGDTKSRKRSHK